MGRAAALPPRHRRMAVHARQRARPSDRPVDLRLSAAAPGGHRRPPSRTRSITAALQRLGVGDYLRAAQQVSSRLPTAAEADALARPPSEPVLVVQFVNTDASGRPVEAGRTLFAADAVQLSVEHDVESALPRRLLGAGAAAPAVAGGLRVARPRRRRRGRRGRASPRAAAAPWRYGFHATLKAPMALAGDVHESNWLAAVRALAARYEPFEMPHCAWRCCRTSSPCVRSSRSRRRTRCGAWPTTA